MPKPVLADTMLPKKLQYFIPLVFRGFRIVAGPIVRAEAVRRAPDKSELRHAPAYGLKTFFIATTCSTGMPASRPPADSRYGLRTTTCETALPNNYWISVTPKMDAKDFLHHNDSGEGRAGFWLRPPSGTRYR